ncbi:hypothetical protein D5S19_22395 [Amycolatopsis panacis]|uniref:Uncharacterized protein n=1 Tax=Amycolatopsis panacis TaxID=2340917 RepID=A0A419HYD9_9PSEU|nr:hypothetical protein D5S19_22395 [Amycolatopsis panacis]
MPDGLPRGHLQPGADRAGAACPAWFPHAGRGTRACPGAGLDTYTHYLRHRKEDLYAALETAKFAHPTGTGFLYSVPGTLGHICDYEQLLRELVLEPLGLTDTFYTITLDQLAHAGRLLTPKASPCRTGTTTS